MNVDVNVFKHECGIIINKILGLGKKIIDNLSDENISKVLLDSDFKNRTLLKIIT